MILSTVRMIIPAEKHNDAMKVLRSLSQQIRDEPGCLSCCTCRDVEDSNVLIHQEHWKSEESLNQHVRSSVYRNLLLVMEMSLEQPVVRFDTISGSTGFETISKIRKTIRPEDAFQTTGSRKKEERRV